MSASRAIAAGQAAAEALMIEACTIATVESIVPDPLTGHDIVTYGAPIYGPDIAPHHGKCKIQDGPVLEEQDAATATVPAVRYRLDIPVSAPAIQSGSVATMTDGRVLRVISGHRKTWQTAQRLTVEGWGL